MTDGARGSRIGILGGTLDPIHVGHIATALAARDALSLKPVIIMPSRVPPHRQQGPSVSAFHRFAMAALAVNGQPDLVVSDEELSSDGPSYTALTLERLAARGVDRRRLFFITGADAFAEIDTWYRYPDVLDLAHFVVISRPGVPEAALRARLAGLHGRVRDAAGAGDPVERPSVFVVNARTPDVSSTEIRRRLRAGEAVTGLVPGPVETHIRQHRLYLDAAAADPER